MPARFDPDFYKSIVELFHRLLREVDDELYLMIQRRPEEVVVQCPRIISDLLAESMQRYLAYNPHTHIKIGDMVVFQGIKIVPNYEMSIVVYHRDYPVYRKPWMIKKILLEPPITEKEQWYSKTVVNIKEYMGLGGDNFKMN